MEVDNDVDAIIMYLNLCIQYLLRMNYFKFIIYSLFILFTISTIYLLIYQIK